MHRFAITLAAAALAATATAQLSVVIPAGMATAEGSSTNAFPWGRGGGGLLHQCVYDSSHFTGQGITYPILVTGMKWRPNTNVALVASSYTSGCSVSLSTCPVDQAAITTTAANNRGADFAQVFNGVVSWGPQAAVAGPTPFGISIPFAVPFYYDPANGDLNVECDLPIQTFTGTAPQLDVHAASPLASRCFISVGYPLATTGTVNLNHGVVIEVEYIPAAGLHAAFNADATGGPTPLTVNFTDQTFTSAPGGLTSWAWDFDGDSVVDSTAQNPSFTYTACGSYTVSLTVTDGVHPPSTLTRTNYINTDRIIANFSTQVIGPYTVQFTDTSTMPATSWAWDLDGDSIIDSTAQNPVFFYANANSTNVTLTTTRLCSPQSTVTKLVHPVQTLSTFPAVSNTGLSLHTVYYDLDVLNPLGVNLTSIATLTGTTNTFFTIDMYLKQGTHVGSELNAAPWTKVGTASGLSSIVFGAAAQGSFPMPVHIPAGSYGVALRHIGIAPRYDSSANTFANADLSMTLGAAASTTAAPFQAVSVSTPRTWAGTLFYETNNIAGRAGYGWFGQGCPGTLGISSITNTTEPTIGGTLSTTVDNLEFGVALMVIGVSNTFSGPIPLPLDLAFLGASGCALRVSLDATESVAAAGATAPWSFGIPNVPALNGVQLYNQAAALTSSNGFGFVTSHAYGWVVGN